MPSIAGDWDSFWDALAHLAQPALVLAYFSMAYITRMTRAFMIESLSGEYIITARAKGLSAARVLWRHAFGNIAVRLITVLALAYAGLLEGAVITETVFSWPGLGLYLTVSLLNADMNAVLGATLVVGLIYLVAESVVRHAVPPAGSARRMSGVLSPRMAAERDAGLARAGRLGAALSRAGCSCAPTGWRWSGW